MKFTLLSFLFSTFTLSAFAMKKESTWEDKLKWKGSLRYRYQMEGDEAERNGESVDNNRQRQRLKVNLSTMAELNDQLSFHARFATEAGSSSDATSTNHTLGSTAGSGADFDLDRAYAQYKNWGMTVMAGRTPNHYYKPGKTGLVFDSDLNLDGLSASYKREMGHLKFWLNLGHHQFTENKNGKEDRLNGAQVKAAYKFGMHKFGAGFSLYDFDNKSMAAFPVNTKLMEFFAVAKLKFNKLPVQLFYTMVKNDRANDKDSAFAWGVKVGKAKKQGTWCVSFEMRDYEENSVLSQFSDSDFALRNSTDNGKAADGMVLGAKYAVFDHVTFSLKHYMMEYGEGYNATTEKGKEYKLTQLDFTMKF